MESGKHAQTLPPTPSLPPFLAYAHHLPALLLASGELMLDGRKVEEKDEEKDEEEDEEEEEGMP